MKRRRIEIKKDIYIIKNTINKKVYIGQAKNTQKRFISHCSRAKTNSDNSPIHDAINALGRENFYYEILESQIEDYNEKEKYWIQFYNSLVPNGYNLLLGGEEPPYRRGERCWNASVKQNVIDNIVSDILFSDKTLREIADFYQVNYHIIRSINHGKSWRKNEFSYPLRKTDERNSIKENSLELKQIYWLLENSTCSTEQIGTYFKVGRKTIDRINKGITHFSSEKSYPIRKKRHLSKETVEQALNEGGYNE